jgi:hypothetical protein
MIMGKWQPIDDPVYPTVCVGRKDYEFLKLKVKIISVPLANSHSTDCSTLITYQPGLVQ